MTVVLAHFLSGISALVPTAQDKQEHEHEPDASIYAPEWVCNDDFFPIMYLKLNLNLNLTTDYKMIDRLFVYLLVFFLLLPH